MTRSRNASGFYFWCSYNYFNSYLDIRQDALKIFLLNLKMGIDILLNWVYNNGTNKRCGGFNNGLRRNDSGGTGRT